MDDVCGDAGESGECGDSGEGEQGEGEGSVELHGVVLNEGVCDNGFYYEEYLALFMVLETLDRRREKQNPVVPGRIISIDSDSRQLTLVHFCFSHLLSKRKLQPIHATIIENNERWCCSGEVPFKKGAGR